MAKGRQAPATGTATVTVAVKHPTGIVIEAFEKMNTPVPIPGGGLRDEQLYRPTGERFTISGNRIPVGETGGPELSGGFALTHGIPADVWDIWVKQHHDSDLVKNGLIMAFEKPADVQHEAREHRDVRSGMEPLKIKDDPRVPKKAVKPGSKKFVDTMEPFEASQNE